MTEEETISIPNTNDTVAFGDVNLFYNASTRKKNDSTNKKRENIVVAITKDAILASWYENERWSNLKAALFDYYRNLCGSEEIHSVNIEKKGGRTYTYDFLLEINGNDYKVEFKYGADMIGRIPQFVSPTKPSQYFSGSYEEFYYDKYLSKMELGVIIPARDVWLSQVHQPSPECMTEILCKYYGGCQKSSKYTGNEDDKLFYNNCKKLASDSIKEFLKQTKLNKEELSKYLIGTQRGKHYMLFKNGQFHLDRINEETLTIQEIKKITKNYVLLKTNSGKELKVLLRWKNGNGVAYPALQISLK